ncbi:GGDEF domain-containing protein [Bordetella genomosp. 1]|uniref:GGDEF domain-containing protein n=1 Tax=Bordetella genomosp. 1 TaxID=1395607 RepID=A0A261SU71_9BORD|nr:GGDEF domain-containing protein [Bordetella genomosp. 1]OZI40542.1 GGDEF domain-containing protein [Bordetella genomosp. 1]
MFTASSTYSMPTWRFTRWLVHAGDDVPQDIRVALVGGLFGTMPIFLGGVINSLMIASIIAWRIPEAPFIAWVVFEFLCCLVRGVVLYLARRNALIGASTHTDFYMVLTLLWAASVGYGTVISAASGDWVAIVLACLSAAAMVGGICVRNFAAPRLLAVMIVISLGPCMTVPLFAHEPALWVICLQLPLFLLSMTAASYRLNAMLVTTMRAERDNHRLARQDSLTGLLNRFGLGGELAQAMRRAREEGAHYTLLYLDLDGFKSVNDTYGHASGDRLLREVGLRLTELAPSDASIARIGGDEFVLLLPEVDGWRAAQLADRLIQRVAQPFDLGPDHDVRVGGSVGIALIPRHGHDMAEILKAADRALYLAKSAGKSRMAMAD